MMAVPNRRPKLPAVIRHRIQAFVRNFAFFAISFVTIWQMYVNVREFNNVHGNAMKMFGFVPGIV